MKTFLYCSLLATLGATCGGALSCQHLGSSSSTMSLAAAPQLTNFSYDFTSFPSTYFTADASADCVFPKPQNILELELTYNCSPRIHTFRAFNGGKFTANIKPPSGSTPGTVSSFYMSSGEGSAQRSEVDFEFLGNHPTSVQVNLFVNGVSRGGMWRELGYNVGDAAHDYTIEITSSYVTWYADGKPIYTVDSSSQPLPNKPLMIYASFWNASDMLPEWAGIMNWSSAPFWFGMGNFRVENAY